MQPSGSSPTERGTCLNLPCRCRARHPGSRRRKIPHPRSLPSSLRHYTYMPSACEISGHWLGSQSSYASGCCWRKKCAKANQNEQGIAGCSAPHPPLSGDQGHSIFLQLAGPGAAWAAVHGLVGEAPPRPHQEMARYVQVRPPPRRGQLDDLGLIGSGAVHLHAAQQRPLTTM